MNNVHIDFSSLSYDVKYPNNPRHPLTPKKIGAEEFNFPQSICENGNLRYAKYTKAKKQKLLQNLKTLIAKNILYISIKINDDFILSGGREVKYITEVRCLGNEELSFQ